MGKGHFGGLNLEFGIQIMGCIQKIGLQGVLNWRRAPETQPLQKQYRLILSSANRPYSRGGRQAIHTAFWQWFLPPLSTPKLRTTNC